MSVFLANSARLDKEKWDELVSSSSDGSVFLESWFIDCLTQNNWDAFISINEKNDQWLAAIPIYKQTKMGNVFSRQPLFSKYWGVFSRDKDKSGTYQKLHFQKEQMALLLKDAANVAIFDYFTGIEPSYPAEYKWQNIVVKPVFTYTVELEQGIENIRSGYSKTARKRINKLGKEGFENKFVSNSNDLETVLKANLDSGKQVVPIKAVAPLLRISKEAFKRNKGFFLSTYAQNGELAAAGFFLHNHKYTHFLSGYVKPEYRSKNAMNLLVDGAIEHSKQQSEAFDFYGSSIESIEAFFRSFGAESKPYYRIVKTKFPFNLIWKT